MQLAFVKKKLEYRIPFGIAGHSYDYREVFLVALKAGDRIGYGEIPIMARLGADEGQILASLNLVKEKIVSMAFVRPETLWRFLNTLLKDDAFTLSGLDMAAWDLYARMKGEPTHKVLGLRLENLPHSAYTIGMSGIETMKNEVSASEGWPALKIKVGHQDDILHVRALRQLTNRPIYVDVNEGWRLDEALEKIPQLEALDVAFVEQPLPRDDWEGMQRLYRASPLPLFADESIQTEKDFERAADCFHGFNLKLGKLGGFTPMNDLVQRTRRLGKTILLGCLPYSTVGVSALAHVAGWADWLELDSTVLLKADLGAGVTVDAGRIHFPDPCIGHGVALFGDPFAGGW